MISEIGYFLIPSRDITEILLKRFEILMTTQPKLYGTVDFTIVVVGPTTKVDFESISTKPGLVVVVVTSQVKAILRL